MGRRKTIIVIAVVAALTLAIAGSAYAFTVGGSRGDQDNQPAAAQAAQDDTAQSPTTTSPEGTVGPIQQRDRVQDPGSEDCDGSGDCEGSEECDGTCDQVQEQSQTQTTIQNSGEETRNRAAAEAGQANGTRTQAQTRTEECDGDCEQTQSQNGEAQASKMYASLGLAVPASA